MGKNKKRFWNKWTVIESRWLNQDDTILKTGSSNQVSGVELRNSLVEKKKVRGWNSGPVDFTNSPFPGALIFMKTHQKIIKFNKTYLFMTDVSVTLKTNLQLQEGDSFKLLRKPD